MIVAQRPRKSGSGGAPVPRRRASVAPQRPLTTPWRRTMKRPAPREVRVAEKSDSNVVEDDPAPIARLLIEPRPFEVTLSAPAWLLPADPDQFPILVDVNRETEKLEGHRARWLSAGEAVARDPTSDGGTLAVADYGSTGVLTAREREVLSELTRGASNKTIARTLGISTGTVRVHVKSVLRKLALENRTQAAVWAAATAARESAADPPGPSSPAAGLFTESPHDKKTGE
jgi:DNA-binding CsgD family transcriptional regulator